MSNSFELVSLMVSEFASQDVFGRWNFIGTYTDGAEYPDHLPETMPPFYLSFILEPKVKDFNVFMRLRSPSDFDLFQANNTINANMDPPQGARFVWIVQIPIGIPLREEGYFTIDLGDAAEDFNMSTKFRIASRKDLNAVGAPIN